MLICDCCGLCCKHLRESSLYDDLDRGDGVCMHLDEYTNICSIYHDRPDKCNIDKVYDLCFKDQISRDEFYKLNYEVCNKYKKEVI